MKNLFPTIIDLEAQVGESIRARRLYQNIDQHTLAVRAGVSLSALKRLEAAQGSTVRTLVRVLRALGCASWIDTLAPVPSINPMTLPRSARPRQRAAARRLSTHEER